jgi:hypothetical protein
LKQSPALGRFLLQHTALFADESLLIVVSPFKRTLQTLLGMMEAFGPAQWKYRTIIQPMCGEYYKGVGGDVGTNRAGLEQLFPRAEYPAFDFSTLDTYCAQWDHTRAEGSWWTHGTSLPLFETLTIQQRGTAFRLWLANTSVELKARHVLVVSHGGILRYAFPVPKSPKYENCEVKTFDLYPNGQFRRSIPLMTAEAQFPVDLIINAVRAIDYNTCTHFEIIGKACGIGFVKTVERMSDLKENVFNLVSAEIHKSQFTTSFPIKTTVSSYGGFFQTSSYNWTNLKPWLTELGVVLNSTLISNECKYQIVAYFLERW